MKFQIQSTLNFDKEVFGINQNLNPQNMEYCKVPNIRDFLVEGEFNTSRNNTYLYFVASQR